MTTLDTFVKKEHGMNCECIVHSLNFLYAPKVNSLDLNVH